jgi:hypothetical protein
LILDSPQAQDGESTTLLAAAALGMTGRAEIRDDTDTVFVSNDSADGYILPVSNALAGNQLAQKLAATHSLAEAEAVALSICGRPELSNERQKAKKLRSMLAPSNAEARRRLEEYWTASTGRGVTLATFRRVAEVMKLTRYDADLVRSLVGAAEQRWRAVNIPHLVALGARRGAVREGQAGRTTSRRRLRRSLTRLPRDHGRLAIHRI